MLTKNELENIIKAWPDEKGHSSNAELFESGLKESEDTMLGLFKMRWVSTEYVLFLNGRKTYWIEIWASYSAAKTSQRYQMPRSWDDTS